MTKSVFDMTKTLETVEEIFDDASSDGMLDVPEAGGSRPSTPKVSTTRTSNDMEWESREMPKLENLPVHVQEDWDLFINAWELAMKPYVRVSETQRLLMLYRCLSPQAQGIFQYAPHGPFEDVPNYKSFKEDLAKHFGHVNRAGKRVKTIESIIQGYQAGQLNLRDYAMLTSWQLPHLNPDSTTHLTLPT